LLRDVIPDERLRVGDLLCRVLDRPPHFWVLPRAIVLALGWKLFRFRAGPRGAPRN
jgi:hypothetical protein